MSFATESFLKRAFNQNFGVEIEMFGISRTKVIEIVANIINGTKTSNGHDCVDIDGRIWKTVNDSSIHGQSSCELVSPILNYSDIATLQKIVRELRKNGAKSYGSNKCGVHIHVDGTEHTGISIQNLINMLYRYQLLLIKSLNINNNRQNYCMRIPKSLVDYCKKNRPYTKADIVRILRNCNISRYYLLNLRSLQKHGTIEFRLFEFEDSTNGRKNGLHAGRLKAYILLCLALSQKAKEISYAYTKKRNTRIEHSEKKTMLNLLYYLGFTRKDYKTLVKVFTDKLSD